jgi:hypothetical protein
MVFRDFETMDTQQARQALKPSRLAWLENCQPIGGNDLISVPGPSAALATLAGETVVKQFYANFGGIDYVVNFCASGAAYTVNVANGVQVKFANAGTFTDPDMTQWKSERILIADPTGGYATWDGIALVRPGGVSSNIIVTAGGTGYVTPPGVTITGGSGSGATASAAVSGGAVISITLTNAGTGYKAGDVLTVVIGGPGAGAAASAIVWPIFAVQVKTVAVFQGRVWLAGDRNLIWTGTKGYDDVASANAAGSTVMTDSDLPHFISALRSLNNFLYIFGDGSLKQIGSISVVSSVTIFTILTLSSDQGTTFPLSIASYSRLVLFANQVGVFAIFGATVEKISDPMDGVFRFIDFSQPLAACPNDLKNIRCYLLLAKINDPILGVRAVFLTFMNKKWFLISQGTNVRAACTVQVGGVLKTYTSSGSDVTQVLSDTNVAVAIIIRTALWDDGKPMLGKRGIRVGIAQSTTESGTMTITTDSENDQFTDQYTLANPVTWRNALNQIVTWTNAALQIVQFVSAGFFFQDKQFAGSGIYLGVSLTGSFKNFHLNSIVIEWTPATLMRSRNRALS